MNARLLYVMDPMCSWCWGFAPVVEALANQASAYGVSLHLVVGGLRHERAALEPAARSRALSYWQAVEETTGQQFNIENALPEGFVYNTEPACRALVTARLLDESSVWPLALLIQHAFYVEGRDVTQPSVLVELAESVGLPRIEFAPVFDSNEASLATQADFEWALNLGIAGFPTLLAERDGQLVLVTNGYQPLETLSELLNHWLVRGVQISSD
ncbi:putative protein-disulfide isomerase [Pseudomonas duriflava]|uniref:DSBA-like thioredoxin domain-containing protein n=1 Tax=Pseudomonas duriflava TaxID=459528 RepID=A0A562Q9B5_9PSED|nr:DsbA family protein [Pseudomonas duriflava]TWI53355.1 putative protein-disulfide isomerase [Pseudomonas duriflava]